MAKRTPPVSPSALVSSTATMPGSPRAEPTMAPGQGRAISWDPDPYLERGSTGLQTWGGYIFEEFLLELRGLRGMRLYREMADNCPIAGAMLYAIEMLLRQVTWTVEPNDRATSRGEEYADLLTGMLFEDMSSSWSDILSEILSMLPYGFAPMEITYKRRMGEQKDKNTPNSKFRDRLIGWRKWSVRAQETISEWDFDEDYGIRGLWQETNTDPRVYIPIQKLLLFRTTTRRNNPEGRSLLRNAYIPYYYKKRVQEIEGIGIERDLAGLPVLTPPENINIWNAGDPKMVQLKAAAERFVQSVRRDQREGIVKPFGWEFELMSTGSRRQFDTNAIVTRYEQRVAMSVLGDFVMVGHDAVGSKALATSKVHVFTLALTTILDAICDVVNRFAIPRLGQMNGWKQDELPILEHGDVEPVDLAALGAFITAVTGAGMPLFPNPELERHLMSIAKLPVPPEGQPLPSEILAQQEDQQRLIETEGMLADEETGALDREDQTEERTNTREDRQMAKEDRQFGRVGELEQRRFTREDRTMLKEDRQLDRQGKLFELDSKREARGQGRVDQKIQRAGARIQQKSAELDVRAKQRDLESGGKADKEVKRKEARPAKKPTRARRRQ